MAHTVLPLFPKQWEGAPCKDNKQLSDCPPNRDFNAEVTQLVTNDPTTELHLLTLLNTYADIASCGTSKIICNRTMVCNSFYGEVYNFYFTYWGYLHSFEEKGWDMGKVSVIKDFINTCSKILPLGPEKTSALVQ